MGLDEPNHHDYAGELHAEIIRRHAREHRRSQRDYALILVRRDWPLGRIAECLEIDIDIVLRMVAIDGQHVCTECAFDRHPWCTGFRTDGVDLKPCDCGCQ